MDRTTTITPVHVADLVAEGELMPVCAHVIDHPEGRVLVDTGIKELHPLVADMDPRLRPWSEQDVDLAGIDMVVNTHLHFDHCGGNHLFAGKPIYVQRRELDDARTQDDYTIREWVDAPGVRYVLPCADQVVEPRSIGKERDSKAFATTEECTARDDG